MTSFASRLGVSCFTNPFRGVALRREIEKPCKECQPIVASKAKARGMRSQRTSEGFRAVDTTSDRFSDDAGHR